MSLVHRSAIDMFVGPSRSDDEVLPSVVFQKLAPAKLYHELQPFKLTAEELKINGYPLKLPNHPFAMFPETAFNRNTWLPAEESRRKCARCSTVFRLNPDGSLPTAKCTYHHRPQMNLETGERELPCCFGVPGSSKGCLDANSHVFTASFDETLFHFMATPPENGLADYRSKKVYAVDTEQVYTVNGLELARMSIVDTKGRTILDTYVLPRYEVLDYNTAFSGVQAKHLEQAISLEACRQQLFQFVNEATILVGHSLESDLKALRVCHYNVIDTAVLFSDPCAPGSLPRKPALRTLAAKVLQRSVQVGEHCSSEDARVCIDLLNKVYQLATSVP